jgi:hypothetical protein
MNTTHSVCRLLALAAAAIVAAAPRDASAVTLSTVVTNIQQAGLSGTVMLGHAAIASTNYNKLTVSASYTAACNNASVQSQTGQRTLTRTELVGGFGLTTTVPQTIPGPVYMGGFEFLPAGTILGCTYSWTSKAVESGFTIGSGISFPVGGGERADGSTASFVMIVPGVPANDDATDRGSCIP